MTDKEVVQVVARLRKLEAKGREVKVEVDGIRALLREEFERQEVDEIKAGRYRVRRVSYEREQFDAKHFKSQYPDTYALFSKPVRVERVEVLG